MAPWRNLPLVTSALAVAAAASGVVSVIGRGAAGSTCHHRRRGGRLRRGWRMSWEGGNFERGRGTRESRQRRQARWQHTQRGGASRRWPGAAHGDPFGRRRTAWGGCQQRPRAEPVRKRRCSRRNCGGATHATICTGMGLPAACRGCQRLQTAGRGTKGGGARRHCRGPFRPRPKRGSARRCCRGALHGATFGGRRAAWGGCQRGPPGGPGAQCDGARCCFWGTFHGTRCTAHRGKCGSSSFFTWSTVSHQGGGARSSAGPCPEPRD